MNEWEWQLLEDKPALDHFTAGGGEVRTGARVRLRPRQGGARLGGTGVIAAFDQRPTR